MTHTDIINLLIVEDDGFTIDALTQYFATTDDIRVAGTANNGVQALVNLKEQGESIDLILSDIYMLEMNGVELLHQVQTLPNPPVFVAMTSMDTDETMLEILSNGGTGYIIKSARPQQLIEAVRDAMNGGTSVSPTCLSRLIEFMNTAHPRSDNQPKADNQTRKNSASTSSLSQLGTHAPNLEDLPEGEHAVLELLVQGLSNAEIAQRALYSESTVKKHVSSLMKRFQAPSRLKLAISAIHAGY